MAAMRFRAASSTNKGPLALNDGIDTCLLTDAFAILSLISYITTVRQEPSRHEPLLIFYDSESLLMLEMCRQLAVRQKVAMASEG